MDKRTKKKVNYLKPAPILKLAKKTLLFFLSVCPFVLCIFFF